MSAPVPRPVPIREKRSSHRVALLLRAAKLIGPAGEYLGILRDISAGGLKFRGFHPLPDETTFALELANGARFTVAPVWAQDEYAGFRFAGGPVDVAALLCEPCQFARRPLRFAVDLAATARCEDSDLPVRILNLSQDGARLHSEQCMALAQPLFLETPGLPTMSATIRWRDGSHHGLAFDRRFGMEEFSRLLATINASKAQAEPALTEAGPAELPSKP